MEKEIEIVLEDIHYKNARIPKGFWYSGTFPANFIVNVGNSENKFTYDLLKKLTEISLIYICGKTNAGKTLLAVNIAREYLIKCKTVMFLRASEIADNWQRSFNEFDGIDIESGIKKWDLVILDDLGSEARGERTEVLINRLIKTRIEEGLSVIVTSCIPPSEFKNHYKENLLNTVKKLTRLVVGEKNEKQTT